MARSSDDLNHDLERVLDDLDTCPSAERVSAYLDRDLDEDQALEVEFHVNSCASCVELMSLLQKAETATISDPSFTERRDRERRRVAAMLGLEGRPVRRPGFLERLQQLWSVKTPLFVPVGVTALLLCLLVFRVGLRPGEPESPVAILQMGDGILLSQEVGRSAEESGAPFTVVAGEVVPLTIRIDYLEHEAGDEVRCLVHDAEGVERASLQTEVPDDFRVVVPLRFNATGTHTVTVYCGHGDQPIHVCTVEILPPDGGSPDRR